MKKILMMLLLAGAMAVGCRKQEPAAGSGVGELKLSVTCRDDDYTDKVFLKSGAALNTDDFTVVISKLKDEWGADATWSREWTLAEFPELLELAPGQFRITVASPAAERTATDRPTFFVSKDFPIKEDVVTPLELVCGITNMKVTVAPTENFFAVLENYTITVSAEYEGLDEPVSVSWTDSDFNADASGAFVTDKVAYFEPVELSVMVTGNRKLDGSDAALKNPYVITDVEPKDNHILNIDVQVTGELDAQKSFITISGALNPETNIPVQVPGFDEIPIPDDPEDGDDQEPELPDRPSLTWDANPSFETIQIFKKGMVAELEKTVSLIVNCPGKIKEFIITPSENFNEALLLLTEGTTTVLDLVNNEMLYEKFAPESGLYLPTGDELRGKESVPFVLDDLAKMIPIVAKNDGEMTTFSLYLEDEQGQKFTKDIYFRTVVVE